MAPAGAVAPCLGPHRGVSDPGSVLGVLVALTGWGLGLGFSAVAFIVFALIVSMLVPRSRPEFPKQYLGWFIGACILFFALQLTAVLLLAEVGEEHEEVARAETEPSSARPDESRDDRDDPTEAEPTTEEGHHASAGGRRRRPGRRQGGLPRCVRLRLVPHASRTRGPPARSGRTSTSRQPTAELAVNPVTNGQTAMPAFGDSLSEPEIADVAAYVSFGCRRSARAPGATTL